MRDSPYTPGAGHRPPILAGRETFEADWQTMLSDLAGGGRRRARDLILRGPRGVGKTVLLSRFQQLAEGQGYDTISLQAATGGSGLVEGILARAEDRLGDQRPAWQRAKQALGRLSGVNATVLGTGGGLTLTPQRSRGTTLDPGTLAGTLATLAREIRRDSPGGGLLITLDEMQVSQGHDLALIAAALQRLNVEHPDAAVAFAASALPNIDDVLRHAGVTHPDRLFDPRPLPVELRRTDARYAVAEPARRLGVTWTDTGIDTLLSATQRYPAHIQLFADEVWKAADGPAVITVDDVDAGIAAAEHLVEVRTLDPRWLRATDRQAELLAALAVCAIAAPDGAEYATSTELSAVMSRATTDWSPMRIELINEGDIYAPSRGRLSFTVPTYAPYIMRNYEARRAEASVPLASLTDMIGRAARHS